MDLQRPECTVVNNYANFKYNKKIIPLKKYVAAFVKLNENLKWFNIILLFGLHGAFFCVVFRFPWLSNFRLILWHVFIGVVSGMGVTVGAHRLWTHRSFKANLPLRILLMILFGMSGHNPLFNWVRDHRVHHKFSETDADPHNARRGFFFSHIGWLLVKKHPDVVRKGKEVDMSDILADPVIQFHQRYFIPLVLWFAFILPTIVPPLWWGQDWYWSIVASCVGRYVITLNITWLVNSAAHIWGTRSYDRNINPADNIAVALFTLGEGWHNYHHTFPWDYKIGELGYYSLNTGKLFIDAFAKIGWAYDLKAASPNLVEKVKQKSGDGSHPFEIHNALYNRRH